MSAGHGVPHGTPQDAPVRRSVFGRIDAGQGRHIQVMKMTSGIYNGSSLAINPILCLTLGARAAAIELLHRRGRALPGWDSSCEPSQDAWAKGTGILEARWRVGKSHVGFHVAPFGLDFEGCLDFQGGIMTLRDGASLSSLQEKMVGLLEDLLTVLRSYKGGGDDEDGAAIIEEWGEEDFQAAIEDAAEDLLEEAWEEERECLYCSGGCPECDPLEVAPTLSIVIPAPSRKSMIAGGRLGAWATNTGEPIDVGSLEPIWNDPGFLGGDPDPIH